MGHTFAKLLVHVVFGTKHRRPQLGQQVRHRLYAYLAGIARNEFGHALRIGGTADHLHGLLVVRPDVALADAMRLWKGLSSKWIHETFRHARDFAWQSGYAAFSVSESGAEKVIRYIDRQEEHHRRLSFEEELAALLERHGIEYDPQYGLA